MHGTRRNLLTMQTMLRHCSRHSRLAPVRCISWTFTTWTPIPKCCPRKGERTRTIVRNTPMCSTATTACCKAGAGAERTLLVLWDFLTHSGLGIDRMHAVSCTCDWPSCQSCYIRECCRSHSGSPRVEVLCWLWQAHLRARCKHQRWPRSWRPAAERHGCWKYSLPCQRCACSPLSPENPKSRSEYFQLYRPVPSTSYPMGQDTKELHLFTHTLTYYAF